MAAALLVPYSLPSSLTPITGTSTLVVSGLDLRHFHLGLGGADDDLLRVHVHVRQLAALGADVDRRHLALLHVRAPESGREQYDRDQNDHDQKP
jgi:hypothetical protein